MYKFIASGFGTGYAPFAPGTAGSILGILLLYIFHFALNRINVDIQVIHSITLIATIIVLFFGVYIIKQVHDLWKHDASQIVIDEIVGVWITAFFMPFKWQYYLYALIIFRFFDILKPLFIKKIDNLPGDWSVMLDDVLAGVYGLIVMQILFYFHVI